MVAQGQGGADEPKARPRTAAATAGKHRHKAARTAAAQQGKVSRGYTRGRPK